MVDSQTDSIKTAIENESHMSAATPLLHNQDLAQEVLPMNEMCDNGILEVQIPTEEFGLVQPAQLASDVVVGGDEYSPVTPELDQYPSVDELKQLNSVRCQLTPDKTENLNLELAADYPTVCESIAIHRTIAATESSNESLSTSTEFSTEAAPLLAPTCPTTEIETQVVTSVVSTSAPIEPADNGTAEMKVTDSVIKEVALSSETWKNQEFVEEKHDHDTVKEAEAVAMQAEPSASDLNALSLLNAEREGILYTPGLMALNELESGSYEKELKISRLVHE